MEWGAIRLLNANAQGRGLAKPSMSRLYQRAEWIEYRAEVIELDGGVCRRCGKGEKDGVNLHVHHKEYHRGKLPWEYPYEICETLCQFHHAEEHGKVRPSSGWTYLYHEDLHDLIGECECCGTQIRHVFYIDHPKWDALGVGTECCDILTGSDVALNIRRMIDRRKNFLRSKRWKANQDGMFVRQKRMQFAVRASSEGYLIELNGISGKKHYASMEEAKTKIFDIVEDGTAEEFLAKRARKAETEV